MNKHSIFFLVLGFISLCSIAQTKNPQTHLTKQATDALQGNIQLVNNGGSIREQQLSFYKQLGIDTEAQADSLYAITHPNSHQNPNLQNPNRPTCNLTKQVYGWHPYWISTTAYNNYNYLLISTLCYFSYELVPTTGSYSSIHSWKTTNAINLAKAAGSRVDLCVTNFGSANNTTFLGNTAAWATFVDSIKVLLDYRQANGINIDFEGMGSSHRTNFTNFMQYTCNRLHTERPGTTVSIALYSVDWSSTFDMAALNNYVDAFIYMGYDYHYGGGNPGPNAPLHHGSTWASYPYSYHRTTNFYTTQGITKSKLLAGVPYYGQNWPSSSGTPGATQTAAGSAQLYNYIKTNLVGTYTNIWDESSFTPYFAYQVSGAWRQCWWDNEQSLSEKYDMVRDKSLGGIGIWALGYDDGYTQLWDLIYDKFTACGTATCTDTHYDTGGSLGNYLANENHTATFTAPDPTNRVMITFNSFNIEANYDYLYVYDGSSTSSPLLATLTGTTIPAPITSTSNTITIRFTSDGATQAPGYQITWACVPPACTPSTKVNPISSYKTTGFTATFTDSLCSTTNTRFYQVQDNNGTTWRSNGNAGFLSDAFDGTTLSPDWTTPTGTWSNNTNALYQSNEATSSGDNTNAYATLAQNNTATYLYTWRDKIGGTGTNRRAGIHFFCDDATQTNRGNSYFVYYRADNDKMQFYKVTANVFSMVLEVPITVDTDTWYNHKISYNPSTGIVNIYRNNTFVGTWTDTAPLTAGNSISARSGNCKYWVDDLQVFKSRSTTAAVSVGTLPSDMVRYQSNTTTANAGRVISTLISNTTWVNQDTASFKVDWTAPNATTVNDGTSTDVDITTSSNTLSANWSASSDTQSGITSYSYSIGTTAGATNLLNWTNNGTNTTFTQSGLALSYGQMYYVNIRITNGAGLTTINTSDGIQLPCNMPTNLTATPSTTTATLTWAAVSGASTYSIRYRTIGSTTWTSLTASTNSLALSSLTATTQYEAQVATTCAAGTSAYTASTNFTTLTPCNTPTGITISSITTNGATVSFTAVSGATSYSIRYRIVGTTTFTTATITTTSSILANLTAASNYEIQVATVCANGNSIYSASTNFTTLASCGIPTNVAVSGITTTGATITWTAVSGASSYTVRYRIVGAASWSSTTVTTNTKVFTSITSSATYQVQVRSVCASGTSAYTASTSFTTLTPCGVPTGLFTNQLTTTDAKVNWTAVSGATSYTIQRRAASSATWLSTTSTVNYKYLGGFTACTNYQWRVRATCPSGTSAYTAIQTFTTTGCAINANLADATLGSNKNSTDLQANTFIIQPNPARNYAQVLYNANTSGNITLTITDLTGKTLSQQTTTTTEGENTISLNLNNLQAGYYLVMINNPTQMQTQYTRLVIMQ